MAKSQQFSIHHVKTALVFGAGHGIGLALTKNLLQNDQTMVYATYHNKQRAEDLYSLQKFHSQLSIHQIDPTDETSLKSFSDMFAEKKIKIHLILNSVGFLDDDKISPEKSLKEIKKENLMKYFEVNSLPTVLIAKNFYQLFPKDSVSCFANLSAKVGSIEDNKMGGWYGYRSSKSAQNMFIKTISLEFKRMRLPNIVLSIHPGTTITSLSKPYIQNFKLKLHQPEDTALNILNVIQGSTLEQTGSFLSWDGSKITW